MKLPLPARAAVAALATGAAALAVTVAPAEGAPRARAVLRDAAGATHGTLDLEQQGQHVLVTGLFRLPASMAGYHAFHIHGVGTCDPANGFTSAGGHLGSGYAVPQAHGHHDGDMPSLYVGPDGTATLEFRAPSRILDSIFDADGAAVIVHAGPDNFANVPSRYAPAGPDATTLGTGDAGGRVLCGVLAER
jgi:Cu-Zn family superoxide dismutase